MFFYYIYIYIFNNYDNHGNSWLCELCRLTCLISLFGGETIDYMPAFVFLWCITYQPGTAYIVTWFSERCDTEIIMFHSR